MTVREQIIDEVNRLSEEELDKVLTLIRQVRPELRPAAKTDIMSFAGSWADMPEEAFNDFLDELKTRRRTSSRRERYATDAP